MPNKGSSETTCLALAAKQSEIRSFRDDLWKRLRLQIIMYAILIILRENVMDILLTLN